MCLWISHFDLEEALGHAVHFLDLGGICSRLWRLGRGAGTGVLTVCSRPPRRGSSKAGLRAKGDTALIVGDVVGTVVAVVVVEVLFPRSRVQGSAKHRGSTRKNPE